MRQSVRQGVILAAGRGTRLHPLSNHSPKPLHPVCNKPIMQYQMEVLRDAGIVDVAIVIGPTGEPIRRYFGDGRELGLRLEYVEDPQPAGIAASLARTESWVDGPVAVFLGDIFLALNDLAPVLVPMERGAAGTIAVRRDTPEAVRRNFVVLAESDGRARQVIEKPVDPLTDLKGCGLYAFDRTIFDAIRRTPRSALRNEYEITDAIQILIDMGRPVYAADVVRWDLNVTYPQDLLHCNVLVLRERHLDHLVGPGARIGPEVRLTKSVVGAGAVVDAPVTLDECLVLPGARVTDLRGCVRRHIFGEGLVWRAEGDPHQTWA